MDKLIGSQQFIDLPERLPEFSDLGRNLPGVDFRSRANLVAFRENVDRSSSQNMRLRGPRLGVFLKVRSVSAIAR